MTRRTYLGGGVDIPIVDLTGSSCFGLEFDSQGAEIFISVGIIFFISRNCIGACELNCN